MSIKKTADETADAQSSTQIPLAAPPQPSTNVWTELGIEIPNGRSGTRLASLIESALIEAVHEPVGAQVAFRDEYVLYFHSRFSTLETRGFVRHRVTPHIGRQTDVLSRPEVRSELLTFLSRSPNGKPGSFTVRPLATV
jgi:hypothetical protein